MKAALLLNLALAAALLAPLVSKAGEAPLLSAAGEAGYGLRVLEKCQMEPAALERLSDALADVLAEEADRTNADRLAMAHAVKEGAGRADTEFQGAPPLETCQRVLANVESRT